MKRMTIWANLTALLCLLLLSALPAAARADESRSLVFFGDSLTDPGNHYIAFGEVTRPPYQPVAIYPYAMGGRRFSNGPTWAEDLTDELDTPVSGKPALREPGVFTNYAVGRARARPAAPVFPDFDLGTQVGAFLTDFGGHAAANRTYVIWIGANDLDDALEALQVDQTGATSIGIIQQAIGATAESVQLLWADVMALLSVNAGMIPHMSVDDPFTYFVLGLINVAMIAALPLYWVRADYRDEQGRPFRVKLVGALPPRLSCSPAGIPPRSSARRPRYSTSGCVMKSFQGSRAAFSTAESSTGFPSSPNPADSAITPP